MDGISLRKSRCLSLHKIRGRMYGVRSTPEAPYEVNASGRDMKILTYALSCANNRSERQCASIFAAMVLRNINGPRDRRLKKVLSKHGIEAERRDKLRLS